MATRKNKKRSLVKKTAAKSSRVKAKPVAKKAARKKTAARKKAAPKKKSAISKSPAKKKSLAGKKTPAKRPMAKKAVAGKKPAKATGRQSRSFSVDTIELQEERSRSAGQSGDLQGLSGRKGAASESVDELLEEGNSFEAGIVSGVEEAGDDEEKEIRTREVPEDDVPEEYLDND
jgi:hypothetical protein